MLGYVKVELTVKTEFETESTVTTVIAVTSCCMWYIVYLILVIINVLQLLMTTDVNDGNSFWVHIRAVKLTRYLNTLTRK